MSTDHKINPPRFLRSQKNVISHRHILQENLESTIGIPVSNCREKVEDGDIGVYVEQDEYGACHRTNGLER